jgi:hypothetical protein
LIAERAWLFSPLLLMEMTAFELETGKVRRAGLNNWKVGAPNNPIAGAELEVPAAPAQDPMMHDTRSVIEPKDCRGCPSGGVLNWLEHRSLR